MTRICHVRDLYVTYMYNIYVTLFIYDSFICDMPHSYSAWCDVTHSYTWLYVRAFMQHDAFIYSPKIWKSHVTYVMWIMLCIWLLSYMIDSYIHMCDFWLCYFIPIRFIHMWHASFILGMIWRDSFIYLTLIYLQTESSSIKARMHAHTDTNTNTDIDIDIDTDIDTDTDKALCRPKKTHTHTQINTRVYSVGEALAYMHHIRKHTDTHILSLSHTRTQRQKNTHTPKQTHAETHTETHTHEQTHAQTRTHARTLTQTNQNIYKYSYFSYTLIYVYIYMNIYICIYI